MTVESDHRPAVTLSPGDQLLSVDVAGAVQIDALAGEIARALDAQLVTRGDLGSVGPIEIERLSPTEVVRLVCGRHSWALEYRAGRVSRIILVAARDGSGLTQRPIVARATQLPKPTTSSHEASSIEVRSRKASQLRDIIRLSYQKDRAAVDELAGIVAGSADPAVRGAAISALAGIGDARAVHLIATQGLTDRDAQVRVRAAEGIWRTGGTNAKTQLRAAARLDRDPEVRTAIEQLLRDGPPRGSVNRGPQAIRPTR